MTIRAILICIFFSIAINLILPCNTSAQITTIRVKGEITKNTTWSADTIKVDSTITVGKDFTLSIEPGVYVEFQGYYPLNVNGTIKAVGSESKPITFTINDTTEFHNMNTEAGSWHGIRITAPIATDTSILDYCIIEYSKAQSGGGEDTRGGGVCVQSNSRLHISNCIIRNNYARLDGGGIYVSNSYVRIVKNKIYNNSAYSRGGGIGASVTEVIIIDNLIINNHGRLGGGGIFFQICEPVFANNIISNNESEGEGGGIYLYGTDLPSINNTICYNRADIGGGIYVYQQIEPVFYNDIFWGNVALQEGNQVFLQDFNPSINFYNCNIQGNTNDLGLVPGSVFFGDFRNSIDTLPGFVSASNEAGNLTDPLGADWSLLFDSPCINKGTYSVSEFYLPDTDFGNNKRISHGEVDIGAYEFYQPSLEVCDTIKENITWTADTVKVNCNITILDKQTLTINAGTLVQFQGPYKIEVHGTLLALGTESDSIIFTVADTTGFSDISSGDGAWRGIEFYSYATNDSSKILYSRFEYGKKINGTGSESSGGGIYAALCYRLLISNSSFVNNIARSGGAIYCDGAPITIHNSTISQNYAMAGSGGGIMLARSNVTIDNCIISDNKTIQEGGGILVVLCEPIIKNCTISNNVAGSGGGGLFSYNDSRIILTGNLISKNRAKSGGGLKLETAAYLGGNIICNNSASNTGGGIYGYTDEDILLVNNIICNNMAQYYGGIYLIAGNLMITNNTIANNYAGQLRGGIGIRGTSIDIENSIFWGNVSASETSQISVFNESSYPDILYSNIQGGIESVLFGGSVEYPGKYENNISTSPGFIQPTDSAGINFEGNVADWSLLATSPSVNSGNPLTEEEDILPLDIYGNPRIHAKIIDMGAVENQSGLPVITEQPLNYINCTGESVQLAVNVIGDAYFQWQHNLKDITDATQNYYSIDSVTPEHDGNYQCIVWNAYGIIKSNPAFLRVKSPPVLLSQPGDIWVQYEAETNLIVSAAGTEPIFQWSKDGTDLPGEVSNVLTISESDYMDEGYYKCLVSNSCGGDTSRPVNLYLVPQLCIVTVDPETGNNLIVWEKKSSSPILSYNVYRESSAAGIYDLMTTQSYDMLSIYVDTAADPTARSYLYKITAIDTSGFETDIDLSKPHKTIHLIVSADLQNEATNLQWDFYHGFEYQTYTIYRSSTGLNFDEVESLSATNKSWTDRDTEIENHYYRIAVEKPDPCYPEGSGKKAKTGPYNHSLSNMDDNKLKSGQLPPDTITITNSSILEESNPGTMIGKLLTVDLDTIDSHTYKFVPGQGDDDNFSFTLVGDLLMASEFFDFETKAQYSVRIRSTDEEGNYCEVPFIIQILDIDETTGLPRLSEGAVSAFPNPFTHATIISFPNPGNQTYRMTLMDLSGKVLRMQDNITTKDFILKRDGLEKGLYLIDIKGDKTYRGKLIIE